MKEITEYKAQEILSASKMNVSVEALRRLQNIQGGRGIKVSHSAVGVLLEQAFRFLTIDDRYLLDQKYNQSDIIQRLGDFKQGDLADFLRVRACVGESPRDEAEQLYRAMLMLDRTYGGGVRGGEGGWITDAALAGLGHTEKINGLIIPTPLGRIGQIGDVFFLDGGDFIATTTDGDTWCYVNIRQDAHFYMDPTRDGRIYFTQTAPGSEPTGIALKGEMVADPAVADDALSQLQKESAEWRPQIKIPGIEYFDKLTIHPNEDTVNYSFPPYVFIPTTTHQAWDFGTVGKKEGFSGHCQVPNIIPGYGLGLRIKYCAENEGQSQEDALIEFDYKMRNHLEDMSIAPTAANFILPVPAGSTEQILRYYDQPIVPYSELADRDTWLIDLFARDPADVLDTLTERLLILSIRPIFMVVPEPPLE